MLLQSTSGFQAYYSNWQTKYTSSPGYSTTTQSAAAFRSNLQTIQVSTLPLVPPRLLVSPGALLLENSGARVHAWLLERRPPGPAGGVFFSWSKPARPCIASYPLQELLLFSPVHSAHRRPSTPTRPPLTMPSPTHSLQSPSRSSQRTGWASRCGSVWALGALLPGREQSMPTAPACSIEDSRAVQDASSAHALASSPSIYQFAALRMLRQVPAGASKAAPTGRRTVTANGTHPESVNWMAEGKVSPIKNQAACGSCWAFASMAALESRQLIQGDGKAWDLSEQQLVDCCTSEYGDWESSGCNGRWGRCHRRGRAGRPCRLARQPAGGTHCL